MSKSISDWDREKYLKPIQLYEQNPIIWDAQNAQHFNKNLKNDAWLSIANQMDEDVDIVRKKMISLNGSFRREKSKTKNSMRTGKGNKCFIKTVLYHNYNCWIISNAIFYLFYIILLFVNC